MCFVFTASTVVPCISIDETRVVVNQGHKAVLHCDVQGYPSPEVKWYFGTSYIDPSDTKYTHLKEVGGKDTIGHRLFVADVLAEEDSGNYSCRATNEMGEQSRIIILNVASKLTKCSNEICLIVVFGILT